MRTIDVNIFVNSFKIKPDKSMSFLLGAGASVSSNIPSGGQMVWDFKRNLYCASKNIRTSNFPDMSKKNAQDEIQRFFDGQAGNPSLWSSGFIQSICRFIAYRTYLCICSNRFSTGRTVFCFL